MTELDKLFTKTDAESVHLDVVPLGHQKMPKLVDSHQKAQPDKA